MKRRARPKVRQRANPATPRRRFRVLGGVDPRGLPPGTAYPCNDPYIGARVAGDDFAGTVLGCATVPAGKRGAHFVIGSVASGSAIGRARKQRAARAEALRARYEGEDFDARPARRAKRPRAAAPPPRELLALPAPEARAEVFSGEVVDLGRATRGLWGGRATPFARRATLEARPEVSAVEPETVVDARPVERLPRPVRVTGTILSAERGTTLLALLVEGKTMAHPALAVVDDGVRWTRTRYPTADAAFRALGLYAPGTQRAASDLRRAQWTNASARLRALLHWGRTSPASERVAPSPRSFAERLAPCPVIGEVAYNGWATLAPRSAHSFEALHATITRAVVDCAAAWGWRPEGLSVSFFSGRNAMGLAFEPGKGDRRIALRDDLLERYDLDSVSRVVRHELCHHAREELHPRARLVGVSRSVSSYLSHDARFCSMLAQVDPRVASEPESCRLFNDETDADAEAATLARQGVRFTVDAGVVEIGRSGRRAMRFRWKPVADKGWRPTWEAMTDPAWRGFLARFPPEDRWRLRVQFLAVPVTPLRTLVDALRVSSPAMARWFEEKMP